MAKQLTRDDRRVIMKGELEDMLDEHDGDIKALLIALSQAVHEQGIEGGEAIQRLAHSLPAD